MYFKNGKALTELQEINQNKYYFSEEGIMLTDTWLEIKGTWYYFRKNGIQEEKGETGGNKPGMDY